MRKIFLSFLLATTTAVATTPAVAQRTDREERAKEREDRQSKRTEAREERQSKSAKAAEEAKPAKPVVREERVQQRAVQQERVQPREERAKVREERVQQRAIQQEPSARPALKANRSAIIDRQEERRELIDQRRNSRATGVEQSAGAADAFTADREQYLQQRRQARAQLQQQRQELSRERLAERVKEGRRLPPPPGAAPDRPAPPPPVVETSKPAPSWSATHWRRDNRHDWRRWRDHNRSLFRLGYYFDPFGWGYHRYGIGWRLWPAYYNEYFWLNDPWEYRLPYAPWPYQWVRYYNDALLVNVFTGQVVDVEYNFFW